MLICATDVYAGYVLVPIFGVGAQLLLLVLVE